MRRGVQTCAGQQTAEEAVVRKVALGRFAWHLVTFDLDPRGGQRRAIEAELLRREPDGTWPEKPEAIETGTLNLECVGFSVELAAFYRTTRLAAPAA